jgi:hypothetical protein
MNRADKIAMFSKEIGDITDGNLRKLATEIIACADDYFFTIPASSSGKNHPPFSLGEGGLVRHTKCVVYMVECLCESFNIDEYKKDMLIVAALAHDIKKQGDCAEGLGHTVHEHPLLAARYVQEVYVESDIVILDGVVGIIAEMISTHMGKWGANPKYIGNKKPLPFPQTECEKILQAADYLASRKEILDFKFVD